MIHHSSLLLLTINLLKNLLSDIGTDEITIAIYSLFMPLMLVLKNPKYVYTVLSTTHKRLNRASKVLSNTVEAKKYQYLGKYSLDSAPQPQTTGCLHQSMTQDSLKTPSAMRFHSHPHMVMLHGAKQFDHP